MSVLAGAVVACGKVAPPPAPDAAVRALPEAMPVRAAHDAAVAVTKSTDARATAAQPPADGCVVRSDRVLDRAATDGLAGWLAGAPCVLGFTADTLSLWTLDGAASTRRWQRALEAPIARAALACRTDCTLVLVDARARLIALTLDRGEGSAPRVLASGVDRRFAPALAPLARDVLIAYTTTRDEVMHTMLVRSGEEAPAPVDLTPPGHGAAAATFVLGAPTPTLVMIDARAGISPLLEVSFDAQGTPAPAQVRTPVSQPSAPPLLAATRLRGGEVEVYYSLTGKLAMTAIGRVPLRRAVAPTPLLPSRGYGALRFAAATSGLRTLVALEVPTASAPEAPRTLSLKLLDGLRTDDVLSLAGSHPTLASGSAPGSLVLTYVAADGLHGVELACDAR